MKITEVISLVSTRTHFSLNLQRKTRKNIKTTPLWDSEFWKLYIYELGSSSPCRPSYLKNHHEWSVWRPSFAGRYMACIYRLPFSRVFHGVEPSAESFHFSRWLPICVHSAGLRNRSKGSDGHARTFFVILPPFFWDGFVNSFSWKYILNLHPIRSRRPYLAVCMRRPAPRRHSVSQLETVRWCRSNASLGSKKRPKMRRGGHTRTGRCTQSSNCVYCFMYLAAHVWKGWAAGPLHLKPDNVCG